MDVTPVVARETARGTVRLAAFATVVFVSMVGIASLATWVGGAIDGRTVWAIDFNLLLDAGSRFLSGEPLYSDPKFLYPPLAAVVASPFTIADPLAISLAYAAMKVLIATVAVLALSRPLRRIDRGLACLTLCLSLPFLHDVILGNANTILAAAIAVAALARPTWASGIALGLAAAMFAKPLLVPVGLWLLVYRRHVLAGTVVSGLAATAVGIVAAGPAAYLAWIGALTAGAQFASPFAGNSGLSALLPQLWMPVAVITAASLIVVLVRRGEGTGLTWAVTAGILIAPYAGTYSALPLAVAIPFLLSVGMPFALTIIALSAVATGVALPLYAAIVLVGVLALRPDGPARPRTGMDAADVAIQRRSDPSRERPAVSVR